MNLHGDRAIVQYGLHSVIMAVAGDTQADITDILFRGVRIKRFWVGEWLMSKSYVHRMVAVETVMQYLADGTIGVGVGARSRP